MSALIQASTGFEPQAGPTLDGWRAYRFDDQEVIELEFATANVQMVSSERADGRLVYQFKHAKLPDSALGEVTFSATERYESARLEQGDQNLSLTVLPTEAVPKISQNGPVVTIAFREQAKLKHYASLTTDVPAESSPTAPATPVGQTEENQVGQLAYGGEPISVNFRDTDIKTVMSVFSDFTDLNIVLTESVKGTVSLNLKNVPWDQAFDVVLRASGLVARQSGNVMLVSTSAEAESFDKMGASTVSKDSMEPVLLQTFVIRYQKADYILGLINKEGANFLSPRGTALADEATGKVFIEDTPSRLQKISRFVQEVDKPARQVMIEARVVLVDKEASKELGVSLTMASQTFNQNITTAAGALRDTGGKVFIDSPDGTVANFGYTLLDINGTQFLRARLKALEDNLLVKTVSNPKVVTTNKQEALIEQGTRIPYQSATSSGATETQFQDANLKLQVTPQIGPDGGILLDVDVSKDSVGEVTTNGLAINTRHVRTKVSVKTGGTVVLGGIFEDESGRKELKVPLLGDLPLIGGLFRSRTTSNTERELLIFITPVVLDES